MGHDKLRKFAQNETFRCLLQPSSSEIMKDGFFNLVDQPVKGNWNRTMFAKESPIVLELGCGKGEYTIALAQRNPDTNYIGVDIKGARLWKGAGIAEEAGMKNVAFLRTRVEFITALFAPQEVSEIWLTFSDPQMKSPNSRLSSPLFLERYRKIMKEGGVVHLKTDSRFLHEYTKAVCEANGLKVLYCTDDLYGQAVPSASDRFPFSHPASSLRDNLPAGNLDPVVYEVQTFYEKMFRDQGYKITYMAFVIDKDGDFVAPENFDEKYWREVEGPRRSFGHQPAKQQKKG